MPTVAHSALTGSELHEPKGVDTASNNKVYVADGAGSGAWTPRSYTISGKIDSISSAATIYLPVPFAGSVSKVTSALGGTITAADATLTVTGSSGAMGTIVVPFTGSAAGDIGTLVPTTNKIVAADSFVSVATDGGSTGAIPVIVAITVERS